MKNRRGRKVLAVMLAVLLIQGTGGNFINGWEKRNVQAAEESKMTGSSRLFRWEVLLEDVFLLSL